MDPRRHAPAAAIDRDRADDRRARAVGGFAERQRKVERDAGRRIEIAAADLRVDRSIGMQLRQRRRDAVDAPAASGRGIAVDAAARHVQTVAERGNAAFARRTRGEPVLEGGHVEHRRIEFDATDVERGAAAADRRPRHRQQHALGAQDRCLRTRLARDHVAHHQPWRAAQLVLAESTRGDLQPECLADLLEDQAGHVFRLQRDPQRQRQQQQQHRDRAGDTRPSASRRRFALRRIDAHAPSDSGSSASTNAAASNTRRSSERSPMPT
jgi:hypothetical protein